MTNLNPAIPMNRGMTFGFMAPNGYYASKDAFTQVDRMADWGVKAVSLCVCLMQDHEQSTRIFRDFEFTPSDLELAHIIAHFQKRGVAVMLKPVIELYNGQSRSGIRFSDHPPVIQKLKIEKQWPKWFESFSLSMNHYGRLAEDTGVEMLVIGCELNGTFGQSEHYRETIARLREVYSGAVVNNTCGYPDPEPWFADLDAIGVSFYVGTDYLRRTGCLDTAEPTLEQYVAGLKQGPLQEIKQKYWERFHVPVLFAEFGCRSVVNGLADPGAWTNSGDFDGRPQSQFIEGVLTAFKDEPWWRGGFWWKWDERQDRPYYHQPGGDTGFTLDGKPALATLKEWYGKLS